MSESKKRERERETGWKEEEEEKKKNHGQRYYAVASKSGAIQQQQGGVKREDRPRQQQLSLEAFFYVSFDPDISLSLYTLFHPLAFVLPFVFVVYTHIYAARIICILHCFLYLFSRRELLADNLWPR
jgi:hypothetical protein